MSSNNQDEGMGDIRRWSEFLLPAVGGASGGAEGESPRKSDEDSNDDNNGNADYSNYFEEEGESGGGGGRSGDRAYLSVSSLPSNMSFKSLPSYMKAKSGVEMDPDRVSPFYVCIGHVVVPWRALTTASNRYRDCAAG